MFRRLSVSVGQPGKIGMYMKDKLWISFIYVLIVSILCSIPTIISVCSYKGFTTNIVSKIDYVYKTVKDSNTEEEKKFPEVQIIDYKLVGTGTSGFAYRGFGFYINEKSASYLYDVFFKTNGVDVSMGGALVKSYTYKELSLDNVDLYNLDTKDADFAKVVKALEYMFNDNKSLWVSTELMISIGGSFIVHFIFALILAFFVSFGSFIPFKYVYKLAIYAVTIFEIFILFSNLFNAVIFSYIGIILAFVYMRRAMRNIIAIKKKVG